MMTAMSISAVADEALAFAGPARLPTRWGEFRMYAVSEPHTGKEHAMLRWALTFLIVAIIAAT